ncbi:MAG: O-antigen ligase family protein [Hyphomicrobiaceae bacterium]
MRQRFETQHFLPFLAASAGMVVVVATQTFTRSRAGLGLTIAAVFCAILLATRRLRGHRSMNAGKLIAVAGVFGVVLALQFALYRILERFDADPLADARIPFARNTFDAALAYFPFGTGLGTFVPIYGLHEKVTDALVGVFANRAHNDFLEFWLEMGLFGAVLFAVFGVWFVLRGIAVWRAPKSSLSDVDVLLPRAATLIILLLLAHSVVDYPMRTGAMLTVFAFACGLLVPAPVSDEKPSALAVAPAEVDVAPAPAPALRSGLWVAPTVAGVQPSAGGDPWVPGERSGQQSVASGRKWKPDTEWPEAWQPSAAKKLMEKPLESRRDADVQASKTDEIGKSPSKRED